MDNRRVFVFRLDYQYENNFILQELRAGRLRQGWGCSALRADESEHAYNPQHFVRGTLAAWPHLSEEEARTRYRILYPMLQMKPGDLIVIPKCPDPYGRRFTITEVSGEYRFNPTPYGDYGHCLLVDGPSKREFDHDESLDAKRVSGKFTSYRKAVNNAWNEGFIKAVRNLWATSPSPTHRATDWATEVQDRTLAHVQSLMADLPPTAVEELVSRTFEQAGYEVRQRHRYDRAGGDADIVLAIRLPLLAEAQGSDLKLFVQVKKRNGTDPNDVNGLEQLERIAADEPMAIKALFSTADSFSEEAERVAQEKGIVLIGGDTAAALLARSLLTREAA